MARPSWDEYFMSMAKLVATRATCPRKSVGAVIVKNRRIIATGYNGSAPHMPHCDDAGCQLMTIDGRESCQRTIHAECNALLQAGNKSNQAVMFVTCLPCLHCAKAIASVRMERVVYAEFYPGTGSEFVHEYLKKSGVSLEQMHASVRTKPRSDYGQEY